MAKQKYKLICGSDNKQNLEKLINEFYFSTNWEITDDMQLQNDKLSKEKVDKINSNSKIMVKNGQWQYRLMMGVN